MSAEAFTSFQKDPLFSVLLEKLKLDGLEIKDFLGKGSYSVVCKGIQTDKNDRKKNVAVKVIDTRAESDYVRKFLPREIALVRTVNHCCILEFFKVYDSAAIPALPYVTFVTELCEGGDLLKKIRRQKKVSETEGKVIFRQLVEALMYLQSKEIIHRDLKCENIFLDRNENVKLGDFGFARVLRNTDNSNTFCGSRAYVAPEIMRAQTYTGQTVDIWSSGVVLFVMVTGVMPYDDRNPNKMVERQLAHKLRFPRSVDLSVNVKTLIMEILHPYPSSRPTYKAMCNSEWLKNTPFAMKTLDTIAARVSG